MIRVHSKPNSSSAALLRSVLAERGTLAEDNVPDSSVLHVQWGVQARPGRVALNRGRLHASAYHDKLEQLQVFQAHNLSPVVFTTEYGTACKWVRDRGWLVLGRNRHHTQGRDIVPPLSPRWREKDFWVVYTPGVKDEWRVHVWRNPYNEYKVFHTQKKTHVNGELPADTFIRNRNSGVVMTRTFTASPHKVLMYDTCRKALEALQLDFAAFDVLETEDGIQLLEANRAPGLDERSANAYADRFQRWYEAS